MNGNPNKNNKAEINPLFGNKEGTYNDIPVAPTNSPKPANEEDIKKLMKLAKCTYAEARVALYNNAHHIYDALRSIWEIVADPDESVSEGFVTPAKSIASTKKTSDPRSSSTKSPSMLTGDSKSAGHDGDTWISTEFQLKDIGTDSEYCSKSDDEESVSSRWSESSLGTKPSKSCRRSRLSTSKKSPKKKTPAKTEEPSKRKRIKDMTPEEYKAYRRPINRRGQKKYRKKIQNEREMHRASPAVQMQQVLEDQTKFANKVLDFSTDARKDLSILAMDTFAAIG